MNVNRAKNHLQFYYEKFIKISIPSGHNVLKVNLFLENVMLFLQQYWKQKLHNDFSA